MLAHSVAASLLGTTPHTDTRASATLLPKPSTSDTLPLATPSARTSSGRPTTSIPSASSGTSPSHHRCPPPSGSILPPLYKETEVAHSYRRQCVALLLTGSGTYEQCGGCRYYLRLRGRLSSDWGVCSNHLSDWDGLALFEHDGCEHFEHAADGWGGSHRSYDYARDRKNRRPKKSNL